MNQLNKSLYFLGIGGTGMASVAGLCQEAGCKISGSDAGVYPPTSEMLHELGIPYKTPYDPKNLGSLTPELVVVANVLSRGNAELEHVISSKIPYTSFPKLLGDYFLSKRVACVVAGTHGKTTTTSILSHLLMELGEDPGFLIGGIPGNFSRSFRLGQGRPFVIEGDEYDTAFFDKGPKFLHYHPKHLILNNIEYDHADIYPDIDAIDKAFASLIGIVPNSKQIIANIDDPGVVRVLGSDHKNRVTQVATLGISEKAEFCVRNCQVHPGKDNQQKWTATIATPDFGDVSIETSLSGRHNMANIAQSIACLASLNRANDLKRSPTASQIAAIIKSFRAPRRRMDLICDINDIKVFEDFAHHPTAVRLVIEGVRAAFPKRRLIVAFEPRSATNRRNVFQNEYSQVLRLADQVFIGESIIDKRIPIEQRFDPKQLEKELQSGAQSFESNQDLLSALANQVKSGDTVIFMSSGSFSGIQYKIPKLLEKM